MIKRMLIGAVLGFLGKKFYDEGKLDPYIAKAKAKLEEQGLTGARPAAAAGEAETS